MFSENLIKQIKYSLSPYLIEFLINIKKISKIQGLYTWKKPFYCINDQNPGQEEFMTIRNILYNLK